MSKVSDIKKALQNSMSFATYIELIKELHKEKKATSFQDNSEFYDYSVLSLRRMERIFKKIDLEDSLLQKVKAISEPQTWMVITESWCGDASQTVPILAKLASQNPAIHFKIVLRDAHEELMTHFLTRGGKSIPILAILNNSLEEIARWGPRPEKTQQLVMNYKASPEPKMPYSEFSAQVQMWYNKDKGVSTQNEISRIISDF